MEAESLNLHRPRLAPPRRLLAAFSDERLATETRRGNDAAFAVLYDRHHRGLLALCRHMLGSREDAEDALQQALASAFRALQSDQPPAQVKPWLYVIARNRCLTMLRARRETPVEEVVRDPTAGLSEEVERRTELRELLADLDHLPERQKTALVLSEVGDLDHAQVAQVLECETKQVKALVFQARSALIEDRRAREVPCAEIREQLATASAGALRRSSLRRHVRVCSGCAEFRDEIRRQRRMLAVALPVVPSLGLKESALAAVGIGGGGAAGGGGLIAALGAHGAAKIATIAIATGGVVGGAGVALPELTGKGRAAAERVTDEERDPVARPSVSRRGPSTAAPTMGSSDRDTARDTARPKRRRDATSAAGELGANGPKEALSRGSARGEGPARTRPPKDKAHRQGRSKAARNDRGRGRAGRGEASARGKQNASSRGGGDKRGRGRSSNRPDAGGNRGVRALDRSGDKSRPRPGGPRDRAQSRATGRGSASLTRQASERLSAVLR